MTVTFKHTHKTEVLTQIVKSVFWKGKKKKKVDILGSQKMCPSLTIYELRKENLFVPQETRIYLWREAQSANR